MAHVAHNTGNHEWYTPTEYIEAARIVLGNIDLDPASSDQANEIVKATRYYTIDDDAFRHDWQGKVWMNPPYGSGIITWFCDKLMHHYTSGDVTEAIVLVNNATETIWFQMLVHQAKAFVFPKGRIKFLADDLVKRKTPLQGQAFLYFGSNERDFMDEFREFGWGCYTWR